MKPEAAVGERELLALYARYKHLALGTGAGLMLDAVPTEFVEETRVLVADCRRAAAAGRAGRRHRPPGLGCELIRHRDGAHRRRWLDRRSALM